MIERALRQSILQDLERKIVLLAGPRQCGKTTLSKGLMAGYQYLTYDSPPDRLVIAKREWLRSAPLIIFDELHKMRNWKGWLKGVYDTQPIPPRILVTGSARLDISRKMGDSLAGRHFLFRLHPFCMKELKGVLPREEVFGRLLRVGGFPEPFLEGSEGFYRRWKRSHLDIIMRQDLLELEHVRDIVAIETLLELLRQRVGTPVSYQSLATDLQRDATTIKRWLGMLENLFVIFRVTPWHRNVARSLLKEPKFYFYDIAQTADEKGMRLENLVAASLLKEAHRVEDTTGRSVTLHYLRTRDHREVDFLVAVDGKPTLLAEVKWSDGHPSASLHAFAAQLAEHRPEAVQLVAELDQEKETAGGIRVLRAAPWLEGLELVSESEKK